MGLPIGFTGAQETVETAQWHLPNGAIARLGKGTVNGITYSPDGTRLVIISSIGMWIYDARTGELLTFFTGHTDIVSSGTYSPDGRTLASGSWDNTVRLWDAHTGQPKTTLSGHKDRVVSVAYSPDGRTLASGSWDNTVRLWDAHTGQLKTTLSGHTHRVNTVAFSPDSNTLATAAQEGMIRLWDITTGQPLGRLTIIPNGTTAIAYSPKGSALATGTQDGIVQLWDPATEQAFVTFTGHTHPVTAIAYSPDGSVLATGSQAGTLRLWDVAARQPLATLTAHSGGIRCVAFSPDGAVLVSGSDDGAIRLWDVATGHTFATISGHAAPGDSVGYSPDGSILAIGSENGTLRLWDVTTQRLKTTLIGHTGRIRSVVFSSDGSMLASSGGLDYTARLWDVTSGRTLAILTGHSGGVLFVAFSPDGRTLASAGGYRDNTIHLWDVATGETKAILRGHSSWVGRHTVAFSPDGQTVASAGNDTTVRLWDAHTAHAITALTGNVYGTRSVAYAPDGQTLASTGADGTVLLWDLPALLSEVQGLRAAVSHIQQQASGQPKVRLAYFYPSDRVPQSGIAAQADRVIKDVQVFYAREMERHGYGIKTFTFEADTAGDVVVHRVKGEFPTAHYQEDPYGKISLEIDKQFDSSQDIFFVFLEVGTEFLGRDVCGLGGAYSSRGGTAIFPASGDCFSFRIVAHELGHALGLYHDHREPNLMSGSTAYLASLSKCAAHFLAVHPVFTPHRTAVNAPPTIQRLRPLAFPSTDIRIRFAVTHEAVLHQVQLFATATPTDPLPGLKLLACHPLNDKSAVFEFTITDLIANPATPILLQGIDVHGTLSSVWYPNAIEGFVQLDLNGDGVLNILDVEVVASNFGRTENLNAVDVNGDGTVNVLDIVLIVGFLDAGQVVKK